MPAQLQLFLNEVMTSATNPGYGNGQLYVRRHGYTATRVMGGNTALSLAVSRVVRGLRHPADRKNG